MAPLSISLLGPFRATLEGQPLTAFESDKVRALLAYLALESGVPHRREALAGLLWPRRPEREARHNLSQALYNLRAVLGACASSLLAVTRHAIRLDRSDDCWLDAAVFVTLLDEVKAHAHPQGTACEACRERLEQAVALYRGEFLAGFSLGDSAPFEEWMLLQQEQFHQLAVDALRRLAACCEQGGAYDRGLAHARRWAELEPWQESAHQQVMRLLALSGERSAALAQYEACRRALREELDVEPSAETTLLYERIRDGEMHPETGFLSETRFLHNLPAQLIPFVGREEMLAQIEDRLRDRGCRLLTLVGPGGSGKTRLALEAAARQVDRFAHGTWFVPLAPLQSAEAIVPTIAQAIGFVFHGGLEPKAQLLDYLRGKNALLVLDNYEHLLDGAALVPEILRTAPEVVVLATSRAALHVQGESLYPVSGMNYPALTPGPSAVNQPSLVGGRGELADIAQYSAVRLFADGARRARPDFSLTDENLADVIRICRLVDGMPLALLLAASWAEMLTPNEIARELAPEIEGQMPGLGLDFLASDLCDVPERQRSMRAVFDHSWSLLPEGQQAMMEALSVFRGGCTREAAQAVAGASLRDLMSLVDRSLLERTTAALAPHADMQALKTGSRFEMHGLLRQYAAGRLAEQPAEDQAAHDRHAAYYAQLIHSQVNGEIRTTAGEGVPEIDNFWAGWQWAAHRARATWMREFVYSLVQGYQALGWWREGITFLREATRALRAVEPSQDRDMALATALAGHAYLLWMIGESEQVPGLFRESQALLRQLDAQEELALCNLWAAWTTVYGDDVRGQLLEESLAIATRIGRPSLASQALRIQAYRAMRDGAHDEAERCGETALRVSRGAGLLSEMRASLVLLGNVAYATSDYVKAGQCYQEALILAEELRNRYSMVALRVDLGDVALAEGEHGRARKHYEDALARYEEASDHRTHVRILNGLGNVALATGDLVSARDHYQRALRLAADKTDETSCAGAMIGPCALLMHRGKVERAAEVLALVLETDPYPIPARSAAYRLLATLQSELSPTLFAATQERGHARDLRATVEELQGELAVDEG